MLTAVELCCSGHLVPVLPNLVDPQPITLTFPALHQLTSKSTLSDLLGDLEKQVKLSCKRSKPSHLQTLYTYWVTAPEHLPIRPPAKEDRGVVLGPDFRNFVRFS